MYRFLAKHVLAPLLDVYRGTNTMKCLGELEKTQWWPRDRILALQDEMLRRLVRHSYDNVPYYSKVFEQRGLKPDEMAKSGWVFKQLRNFRAGIEGCISTLKRVFRLDRCNWKGFESFKSYVLSGVVAYNLVVLARRLLA